MDKKEFLGYVEIHSETPRALFSKEQVAQMLEYAGHSDEAESIFKDKKNWYSIDMSQLALEAMNKTSIKQQSDEVWEEATQWMIKHNQFKKGVATIISYEDYLNSKK